MASVVHSANVTVTDQRCTDPVVLNLWHPIAAVLELEPGGEHRSRLLGAHLTYGITSVGDLWASADGQELPVIERYGYLWTSLGSPEGGDSLGIPFEIPEAHEPDRRNMNAGSFQVATSAPRAIENFLDMGHFPYVHTDLLGVEPHTEVADYQVDIHDGEIWATDCLFFQPVAAASATGGQISEYTYRVPHPFCVMLYKNVPTDPSRRDVIAIFVQAMTEETVRVHNFYSMVDETTSDNGLRRFQQVIFSQDKPILENQRPTKLPLDPRVETPIRADQSAIVYRRWLTELGLTYAVIPA